MVAHYRATAVTGCREKPECMVDLVEACLYEAMRLFRMHIQAVQVSPLLTLPVYIPCTLRAIDVDARFEFSHVSFGECQQKRVCSSGCLRRLVLDLGAVISNEIEPF
jgi:hypothetical protein